MVSTGGDSLATLSGRAKAERRLLGQLSRRLLADRARLHHSYICRILRGERQPSLPAARAMAKALKISMDEFYDRLLAVTNGKHVKQATREQRDQREEAGA